MTSVKAPRAFEYEAIRAMQMRKPDRVIYVAAEPVVLATCCLDCEGTGVADEDRCGNCGHSERQHGARHIPGRMICAGFFTDQHHDECWCDDFKEPTCPACSGSGERVTENGAAILGFIQMARNWGI